MTLFRGFLGGVLALPFLLCGAVAREGADPAEAPAIMDEELAGLDFALPQSFVSRERRTQPPVLLAQAGDPRVMGLQEEVRQLNGKVEELNFLILQMQEQLRKMQEDNEFRFQELEQKKKSDAGAPAGGAAGPAVASTDKQPRQIEIAPSQGGGQPAQPKAGTQGPGTPPGALGSITFDKNGNPTGAGTPPPGTAQPPAKDGTTVAALPSTDDPEELYRNSYQFILSGDYSTAEAGFRRHIERYPADPKTADARFWLGESLLAQSRFRDAAETFLAANKAFPQSKKAPEMMLKLGVSLARMSQKEVACATFNEIPKRYPQASAALKERLTAERALAAC